MTGSVYQAEFISIECGNASDSVGLDPGTSTTVDELRASCAAEEGSR